MLAVLVILAILVAVAVPTVTKYLNDTREKTYKDNASIAIDAVRKDIVLGNTNREGVTTLSGNTKKYSLGAINDLLEKKLVKTSYNTNYDTEKSYIIVSQGTDGTYAFDVCLTDEDHKHTLKSNSLVVDSFVLSEEECGEVSNEATILSMYKSNDLLIGDFVTYDAGTWTQEEIDSIQVGPNDGLVSASGSTSLPSTAYKFGGFEEDQSRNVGAI